MLRPKTTIGGLQKCSIQPIAEHGVIGRGVLIDAARYKGKKHLDRDEGFTLDDFWAQRRSRTSRSKNTTSSCCIRDGSIASTKKEQKALFPEGQCSTSRASSTARSWCSGGMRWRFRRSRRTRFGCEQGLNKENRRFGHPPSALLCNLGVIFNEIVWLKDLAADCAKDGQYSFLFAGAPLKLVYGCGSAVNPIAIK